VQGDPSFESLEVFLCFVCLFVFGVCVGGGWAGFYVLGFNLIMWRVKMAELK